MAAHMTLVARVHAFASRHDLWTPDTRIVAAVSGGSDSVGLLFILHALQLDGRLRLAGAAHLHHHIRGERADADAAFVQALANRLGLLLVMGHADVPALAREGRHSLEVAGRQARLAFFRQALTDTGAHSVALAHTRGDQAETVLLRLARGAGPRGLAGMSPRAGHRIRPLLEVGRGEVRRWLEALGETWREDATNEDVTVARNRLRHEVLPRLAALNPRVEDALARAARIHLADADLLDELAGAEADRLVTRCDGEVWLDLDRLGRLPEALARRVVLRAFETLDPSRAYGWEETDAVLRIGAARARDIGRVRLERKEGRGVLRIRDTVTAKAADGVSLSLDVPGVVRHPAGWWEVVAEGPMPVAEAPGRQSDRAVVDAAVAGRSLTVRTWQAGDRVEPLGLGGRKKVQDVFVDRKVPRDERARVPVVVDARGRIVWVAGHVVSEVARVTPRASAVVVLTLRR